MRSRERGEHFPVGATNRWGTVSTCCSAFTTSSPPISEDLSQRTTAEMGAPITFARQFMTQLTLEAISRSIAIARNYPYETQGDGTLSIREAFGVVGVITPWNNPAFMSAIKIFPALAAGCTVVHKPAENTPLDAYFLAEMIHKVGFPRGVYNLVTGTGGVVGEAIDAHRGVDLISFTGSTGAGRRIAELASRGPTPAIRSSAENQRASFLTMPISTLPWRKVFPASS